MGLSAATGMDAAMPARLPLLLVPLLLLAALPHLPSAFATAQGSAHYYAQDPMGCEISLAGKEDPTWGGWVFQVTLGRLCPALGASVEFCSVTGSPAAGFSGPCAINGMSALTIGGTGVPGPFGTGTALVEFGACPGPACYAGNALAAWVA